jgi:hypothetical protein
MSLSIESQILIVLESRPLSGEEIVKYMPDVLAQDIQLALYRLRDQKMWIEKHPVISGGCTSCACGVTYKWRLTFSGRKELGTIVDGTTR